MKKIKQRYRGMNVRKDINDKKKLYYGFTLIEVVMTVALIVILSAISVPIYKKHSLAAKRAEGYVLLGVIRDEQKQYFSEYRSFLSGTNTSTKNTWTYTCNEDILGIDARANKYFTNFVISSASANYFISYVTSKEAGVITQIFNKDGGITYK